MRYYRIHDNSDNRSGALETPEVNCKFFNKKGYGIFWLVNSFHGPRQQKYLEKINYWFIDLDTGSKDQQWKLVKRSPLVPSMIIETKRGYHMYWKAEDGTLENWSRIMKDRLIPWFNADKNASDVCRILRAPGYFHMKDPKSKFWVDFAYSDKNSFSEKQMLLLFPDFKAAEQVKKAKYIKDIPRNVEGKDFWEKVYNLDCEFALSQLSGSEFVNRETYCFKNNTNGTKQIYVNGKSTACWIDANKRIGSHASGGPTVAQWLRYFSHSWKDTARILKKEFAQCLISH